MAGITVAGEYIPMPKATSLRAVMASKPKPVEAVRMYAAARPSRLTAEFQVMPTSADTEIHQSLYRLQAISRQLHRDNGNARRIRNIFRDNVIGSGVGIQMQYAATRGRNSGLRDDSFNEAVELAFSEWWESCHTGGLHGDDLERLLWAEVPEVGEVFIREHYLTNARGEIELKLELIEPERVPNDYALGGAFDTSRIRNGVEVDDFGKPLFFYFWKHHPHEFRQTALRENVIQRVPADQVYHVYLPERWPQNRGVPWIHAVIRKLADVGGTSEAEITAMRAAACYMGFYTGGNAPVADLVDDGGRQQLEMQPGIIEHLPDGASFQPFAPNRPNSSLESFLRFMMREISASCDVTYETYTGDYSQSNYSSSRMGAVDQRAVFRALQQFHVRRFRRRLMRSFFQWGFLSGRLPSRYAAAWMETPARFLDAVKYKFRGWSYIDPSKEVAAYKDAVRCGFMTVGDVIAQTAGGADLEDVLKARRAELDLMAALDLTFDTDPTAAAPAATPAASPEPADANV